jgi:4-amino-4-deoxy-L-arabinose transferase-like glycosyltransferase
VLGALSVLFVSLGLYQAWEDAPTFDEPVYLAAGTVYLHWHDVRFNDEHPPLSKVIAVLPALLAKPVIPPSQALAARDEHQYVTNFVKAQTRAGKLRREMFLNRLVPLLEAVLVGFALYALGERLIGPTAGLLAGALWLANPFTLGLGHLNGIDLPFTLAALGIALAVARYLEQPTRRSAAIVGVACGLALLTRHTGLLLAPIAGITVLVVRGRRDGWRAGIRDALTAGAIAWAMIWAGYLLLAPTHQFGYVVLPRTYVDGIRRLSSISNGPAPAYLLGQAWRGARWWYWPGSAVVKLPLPLLVFMLIGVVFGVARRPPHWKRVVVVVVIPALALTAFTITQPRPIGLRYLLPVFAFALLLAAPYQVVTRRRLYSAVLVGVTVVSGVLMVASSPHSLAWTTTRPGYRAATDSNIDWGQDLYRLQRWAKGKDPWVAYFGARGLSVADVPGAKPLIGAPIDQITGWVAASATSINSDKRPGLAWLRAYCPVGTLGGTILLFRFTAPPTPGSVPQAVPRVCRGAASRRVG